jgi:hypothetical protein
MVHRRVRGVWVWHTRMTLHRACDHETILAVRHRGNGEHRCGGVLRGVVLVEDTDHLGFRTDPVAVEAQRAAMGGHPKQRGRPNIGTSVRSDRCEEQKRNLDRTKRTWWC